MQSNNFFSVKLLNIAERIYLELMNDKWSNHFSYKLYFNYCK